MTQLLSSEEYVAAGVHIGTRIKNKHMQQFILTEKADGLKIIDTAMTDERLQLFINILARLDPSEFAISGRRENSKKPIKVFGNLVGCDVYPGRYIPGILTNPELEYFKEYKLVLVCDPMTDKKIINDAIKQGVFTAAICDTNNAATGIDFIIPANNKGRQSLGTLLYLIAREYLNKKGIIKANNFTYTPQDFYDEE